MLALLPVALEMGPMTKGLPGHKFVASLDVKPGLLLLGILAVAGQHACHHWMGRLVEAQGSIETRYEPVKSDEGDEGTAQVVVGGFAKSGDHTAL